MGDRAILDPSVAPAVVNFCISAEQFVPEVSGYWTPTAAEVEEADTLLARGLAELGRSVEAYNRQYTGAVSRHRRLVYVSAASVQGIAAPFVVMLGRPEGRSFDWRRDPFGVCDGGFSVFQAAYDPSSRTFVAFTFGGLTAPKTNVEHLFVEACGRELRTDSDTCNSVTPAVAAKWREVAKRYEDELDDAFRSYILPRGGSRGSPRPALRAAFAHRQAGDYAAAIAVYLRFIASYGSDAELGVLKNDPPQRAERMRFLGMAYLELAATYFASFQYDKAMDAYAHMAKDSRLDAETRKEATKSLQELSQSLRSRAATAPHTNVGWAPPVPVPP